MPDIEETIYRLSIDGSAYVEGANKLTNSTNKFTEAQEQNNEKIRLAKGLYIAVVDELKVLESGYRQNAKALRELIALQEKSPASAQKFTDSIKRLSDEQGLLLRKIVDTKEALKISSIEIKKLEKANLDATKSTGNFASGLKNVYGGLGRIANIIPGLGIASLVAIIAGPVIGAFKDWFDSITKTNDSLKILQKATEESFSGGGAAFVEATENVSELRLNVELAKQGFIDKEAVVNQYNTTMGKTAGTVKTLDEVEQKLVEHGDAYIQMMLLKAAAHFALEKAAKAAFEAEEKSRKKAEEFLTTGEKAISFFGGLSSAPGTVPGVQQAEAVAKAARKAAAEREKRAAIQESEDAKNTFAAIAKKFQEDAAKIAKEHDFNFLPPPPPPPAGPRKVIVNIYEQELQKLKADIAKVNEKGFTDEASITQAIEEDFKKRALAFEKAFKNKQLTKLQLNSLDRYLADLQELTLQQNLKLFREQKGAYLAQIETELNNLQLEENTKRIANIQNRFDEEREVILSETEKTINSLQQRRDKLITDILKNAAKSGLTAADIAPQVEKIKEVYARLFDDVEVFKNQRLQQLSFDIFEKISEDLQKSLKDKQFDVSSLSLIDIQKQTELLAAGKISFEQYQKELTRIAKEESDKRRENEIANLRIEIGRRQAELRNNRALSDDQQAKLLEEIRNREAQVNALEKADATGVKKNKDFNDKLSNLVQYTQAIGNLAQNVISFWQQANAAESAALERSIALQQRRVDAAQRIAERGNAQYLKQEQDRLTDLNTQRENAARKQLGINAALQGSEILVSLISGIAQGAKLGGALGAITSVAAIVAAIAGAFAIAQSLKPPTPTFFVGTKDTGRGGAMDSKGGFAATLHPNEAVIPASKNKAYKPAVNAIYDGTIPPETLNRFVTNYHKIKSVPLPNYERIKDAAALHIGSDGRMSLLLSEQNKKMDENTLVQKQVLRALKSMGVNVNMDKNGIAVSVMEAVEQIKINSRA